MTRFSFLQINDFFKKFGELITKENIVKSKDEKILNLPCGFDIETSSFYCNGEKTAIMYEWTFGIDNIEIFGRTWDEFGVLYEGICAYMGDVKLICYIHNLSYEFQFMRKHIPVGDVFAVNERKPIYVKSRCIIFKCSYLLSGKSLEEIGNELGYKKLKTLRYDIVRSAETPLSSEELEYCFRDVEIVIEYIRREITFNGKITKIPNTKTGYVRRDVKDNCLYYDNGKFNRWKRVEYNKLMMSMNLDVESYKQLKRAFAGGFTHANNYYVDEVIDNVKSYDISSSYPFRMVAREFPMSTPELIEEMTLEELEKIPDYFSFIFDVDFTFLESRIDYEHFWSSSRVWGESKVVSDNGRIVRAEKCSMSMTNVDWKIFKKCYTWEGIKIEDVRLYRNAPLPKDIILILLDYFTAKTVLKGVEGKEDEYGRKKVNLNSIYGMCVTDILRPEYVYKDGEWKDAIFPENIEEKISQVNNKYDRFLYFPWGVWVCAYAREELWEGIFECEDDYIYSDTDSLKFRGNHEKFFNKKNREIQRRLNEVCIHYKLPKNSFTQLTNKGESKTIGVWEKERDIKKFKTLGAKRYLCEYDTGFEMTVAGVSKKAISYLTKNGKNPFDMFTDDLYIPSEYTHKLTHTYIDYERRGIHIDYLGNEFEFCELSSVHLEPCDFTLNISDEFINFLKNGRSIIE